MKAFKIPRDQRILLLPRKMPRRMTRWYAWRTMHLKRWAGELPSEGVMTPTGIAAGCCGHYSFWKLRILLHKHPGDRPLSEEWKEALRGEGPVPLPGSSQEGRNGE